MFATIYPIYILSLYLYIIVLITINMNICRIVKPPVLHYNATVYLMIVFRQII